MEHDDFMCRTPAQSKAIRMASVRRAFWWVRFSIIGCGCAIILAVTYGAH